jgi:LmbE family N-acetylglucosaminyl deacetylase
MVTVEDFEPMTHDEIERALAKLIRREKPSVQAIALWLKMHPSEVANEENPFAAFATR